MNAEKEFRLVLEPLQKSHFHIRVISWQHPGRMVVIEKFSPELQVEFTVEPLHPFEDLRCLFLDISLIIKCSLLCHFACVLAICALTFPFLKWIGSPSSSSVSLVGTT